MNEHAVTFDCWSTLLYERDPGQSHARRVLRVAEVTGVGEWDARAALDRAWIRHNELWGRGIGSGAPEMSGWTLAELGVTDPRLSDELADRLASASLEAEIVALEGAREILEALTAAGVRRALVCDTGFSPGHVVRRLLQQSGLLELLEVQIFSDETGVPKPHRRMFESALDPLGVRPAEAVHVGDLRRTDVAGARAAGMATVRIRDHHDDQSEHPEADFVADSHAQVLEHILDRFGPRVP
jgi:putative hydrolase of the HAD superfamily